MLRPKVTHLPGHIQSVYVQNTAKLYSHIVQQAEEEEGENSQPVREVTQLMLEKLPMFVQSGDLEVQERVGLTIFASLRMAPFTFPIKF